MGLLLVAGEVHRLHRAHLPGCLRLLKPGGHACLRCTSHGSQVRVAIAGRWVISRSASGGNFVTYTDAGTRRHWVCGETPADVPDKAVLEWVVEQCRYGDSIIERDAVFVVSQPAIE